MVGIERYEVIACGEEGGWRVLLLLDHTRVGKRKVLRSARRVYLALRVGGAVYVRRREGSELRVVRCGRCGCPRGLMRRWCPHTVMAEAV